MYIFGWLRSLNNCCVWRLNLFRGRNCKYFSESWKDLYLFLVFNHNSGEALWSSSRLAEQLSLQSQLPKIFAFYCLSFWSEWIKGQAGRLEDWSLESGVRRIASRLISRLSAALTRPVWGKPRNHRASKLPPPRTTGTVCVCVEN